MTSTPKVYAAMNQVQADLAAHGIAKANTNTYDKYKFRGIDDVYNALSPILAKRGLVAKPSMLTREETQVPTAKGGTQNRVVVSIELKFICSEDGSSESSIFYGEAMDRGDKATPKALTAAYKYGMFSTFCIPTEGSPDADAESPTIAAAPEKPPALTEQQAAQIDSLLAKCPEGTRERLLKGYRAESTANLPAKQYDNVCTRLREIIATSVEASV